MVFLDGEEVTFNFYGSPALFVPDETEVILANRYEKFLPLGPFINPHARLYEMPHGIGGKAWQDSQKPEIIIQKNGQRKALQINAIGARIRKKTNEKAETPLVLMILSWSQIFDEMIDMIENIFSKYSTQNAREQNKIPWSQVLGLLSEQSTEEVGKPRQSLIVRIAESMKMSLPETVMRMRRILLRERALQRINHIREMDLQCLQYYARKPGFDMAEKAGSRQELLAVVRKESYDLLENRVLKDFLKRGAAESKRYLENEIEINPNFLGTNRDTSVRGFQKICMDSLKHPDLRNIALPGAGIQPNYVLQNDLRYRNIWKWYCKLLKREDDEDRLWDWQARTWADIVRLLVNLAIVTLEHESQTEKNGLAIEEMFGSSLHVVREQVLGCRTRSGSEPGPFIVKKISNKREKPLAILEVVHPDEAKAHDLVNQMGVTGGHLYLVIKPLANPDGDVYVIIIWAVHTAGSGQPKDWEKISMSAGQSLHQHYNIFNRKKVHGTSGINLQGIVAASSLTATTPEAVNDAPAGPHAFSAPLLIIPSDVPNWKKVIEDLAILILERLGAMV